MDHSGFTNEKRPFSLGLYKIVSQVPANFLAIFFSSFVLIPFVWVIFTAVKSPKEVAHNPLGTPIDWQWANFLEAWKVGHFDKYLMNSIIVLIPTLFLILVFSTLAAFAFSTLQFRGKNLLFATLLIGLTVPLDILIIPLFYDLLDMKLLNTYWALILPQAAASMPFGILLLRSFMEDIPREILDSAQMDGCSDLGLLFYIITPLSMPVLASLLIFSFMWTWNQFLLPIVLIQDDALRTLPVGFNYFQGKYVSNISLTMAGAVISFMPVIVIYAIFQRQFIRGITAGALK
jgi:ABC-type glycerol-3-phosphate transport system permease component